MKRQANFQVFFLIFLATVFGSLEGFSQFDFRNTDLLQYRKNEIVWGIKFSGGNEREETRTDLWRSYEKLTNGAANLEFNNRFWNYTGNLQQSFEFKAGLGPLFGKGNWIDSSSVANIEADHKITGFRTNAVVGYSSRYYYNEKSFTLVQLNGWARYDLFRQNSTGISVDSDRVVTGFEEISNEAKFRYMIEAKAGWGFGKLKPVNHFMIADYILQKYYNHRRFSEDEILKLANEIGIVKHRRNQKTSSRTDIEKVQIQEYLNKKMFLIPVDIVEEDWEAGEFLPRYNGSRIGFGPFFNYFNREPDFTYGGYINYENARYCSVKWNRNFRAGVNYVSYKKRDWILGEFNIGWSYFVKLKSQIDFGIKYVPGIEVNRPIEINSVNNSFMPYLGYFTQIDPKKRIDIKLAYRFSEDDGLILPGPEFSVLVYRSRY